MRIDWAGDDFGPEFPELLDAVVEGQDLGRADEGEGQWVEEEDQVLALEVGQLQLLELSIDDGGARPVGSRLGDEGLGPLEAVAGSLGLGGDGTAWKQFEVEPWQQMTAILTLNMEH